MEQPWTIRRGTIPLIATAIHDGHDIGFDILDHMEIGKEERLREEDPHTSALTSITDTQIIVHRSRFEVDLNRPRDKAVYKIPDDAWGLKVWKEEAPEWAVSYGLEEYDQFNRELFTMLDEWRERFGAFVIYDIHSYNHRREGPEGRVADPIENPEVNVGVGTLNLDRFGPIVDRFVADLSHAHYFDHPLDVRVNVKFKGGDFSRRIHERYPDSACVLAIEFKKIFMDEWTGELYEGGIETLTEALASTVPGVLEELRKVGERR